MQEIKLFYVVSWAVKQGKVARQTPLVLGWEAESNNQHLYSNGTEVKAWRSWQMGK